jgi:hypothetical protein
MSQSNCLVCGLPKVEVVKDNQPRCRCNEFKPNGARVCLPIHWVGIKDKRQLPVHQCQTLSADVTGPCGNCRERAVDDTRQIIAGELNVTEVVYCAKHGWQFPTSEDEEKYSCLDWMSQEIKWPTGSYPLEYEDVPCPPDCNLGQFHHKHRRRVRPRPLTSEENRSRRGEPVVVKDSLGNELDATIEFGDESTSISVYCERGGRMIIRDDFTRIRPDPGGQRPVWNSVISRTSRHS